MRSVCTSFNLSYVCLLFTILKCYLKNLSLGSALRNAHGNAFAGVVYCKINHRKLLSTHYHHKEMTIKVKQHVKRIFDACQDRSGIFCLRKTDTSVYRGPIIIINTKNTIQQIVKIS